MYIKNYFLCLWSVGYIYGMQSRMREYVSKTRELCRKFNLDHLPVVDADLHACAS